MRGIEFEKGFSIERKLKLGDVKVIWKIKTFNQ
jgi:hypothetical protein